jgi:integrase
MPTATIEQLKIFSSKLRVEPRGIAERHLPTLRQFDDPAAVRALINLPARICTEVRRSGKTGPRQAKRVQTALAIELLLIAPVRIANLSAIEIDRHLVTVQKTPRLVYLRFPRTEVKNGEVLEFPLAPETLALLEFYLEKYWPLLPNADGPFLFAGKSPGRPKATHALSRQIDEAVFQRTGMHMPAHRFRHATAKIFLDRNPGQYEVVRRLLGHRDIRTTIAFYAGTETPAAARHYAETILKLRSRDDRDDC